MSLIEAFDLLVKDNPEVRLLLIGDGPLRSRILSQIKAKSIEDYIHIPGRIQEDELNKWYASADVYVSSSVCDGSSVSMLEAMACGCPTLSSNMASLPEIGGKAVHFFDPMEISDIAESIQKVCEDSKYRQTLAQRGSKHVKKFDWETSFKKHMDLFETVLS